MKTFRLKTTYCDEECYIEANRYVTTGNLSLHARSKEGMNMMLFTINLDFKLPDDIVLLKDYSENEGLIECLVDLGFIDPEPVNRYQSGFVTCYTYRLKDKIYEYIINKEEILGNG